MEHLNYDTHKFTFYEVCACVVSQMNFFGNFGNTRTHMLRHNENSAAACE